MKSIIKSSVLSLVSMISFMFSGCEQLVEGINENPNQLTLEEVDAGLFMNGAQLSNINIQLGPYSRMAAYYSGQLIGYEQVERFRYQYEVVNTDFDWSGYQSVVNPAREIRRRTEGNALYQGITKVLEAHVVGTYASLFGDIPYSEAISDVDDPVFDNQLVVFEKLQTLLDGAISDLENSSGQVIAQDFIFAGNRVKWLESAWTLKARYYMSTKQYEQAYQAALNGISLPRNSMRFTPLDLQGENSTKNKYFIVLQNGPNLGTGDSYLMQLLDAENPVSRNNEKTNESARSAYYYIDRLNSTSNMGIAHELESQPLLTYEENLLILAESGARTQGLVVGLEHLNSLRAYLNSGAFLNINFAGLSHVYLPYLASDFEVGGMENMDGIDPIRALLREIVEERYVSGFTMFMPFDDARRLRKGDSDIAVPFPLNIPTATLNIERFLVPEDEMTTNENAPVDPGLFSPTQVNQ
ncbi:SusD/RagB family nutrient-binding outer membrane lipoprotein [Algoriphagus sp. D3-2-R+10]|uniref:SusD/RagB family nutrient-binding outer membrane lipoprotein n=1 Tax=Algoriphagus aurantiacus TaxID=3103948 RepID=UPI002B39308C|nr:SusD/RagB family nutrient-binding outer membrane lipoprotein [Algoriphagus sp. D3-2-R+10]MEB2777414.1 SusD/RagB family nutrient-binding outer membrane lipoprotein [Algoriphagus sp. D3-2-R+10]